VRLVFGGKGHRKITTSGLGGKIVTESLVIPDERDKGGVPREVVIPSSKRTSSFTLKRKVSPGEDAEQ